jgi:hypothetical protein
VAATPSLSPTRVTETATPWPATALPATAVETATVETATVETATVETATVETATADSATASTATGATASRPPAALQPPQIETFEISKVEPLNGGRRLTFRWTASGAYARILSGTAQRMAPWWTVPLSGTLTVDLSGTNFRDPVFTLEVSDKAPPGPPPQRIVTATAPLAWPCMPDYFFTPLPRRCPLGPAGATAAAEQRFEGGRMIWLGTLDTIIVFYGDGYWARFEDTWTEAEPESDAALQPPADLVQPVRGFGKVWREQPGVRELLGWGLAPEQGYTARFQHANHEGSSSGAPFYVSLSDGRVRMLSPLFIGYGPWEQVGQVP